MNNKNELLDNTQQTSSLEVISKLAKSISDSAALGQASTLKKIIDSSFALASLAAFQESLKATAAINSHIARINDISERFRMITNNLNHSKLFETSETIKEVEKTLTKIADSLKNVSSTRELENLRVLYLGKNGELTSQMKSLGNLPIEERKTIGAIVNITKDITESSYTVKQAALAADELDKQLAEEKLDLTLPTRAESVGRIHPITQVMDELAAVFAQMGFSVAEGPDIEDDEHNFNALNIPPSHPARQMHDTFYMRAAEGQEAPVLRTHTSPVQIRAMRAHAPEFAKGHGLRIIAPGTTYRSDSDATHTPMFHQVEGLVIEKNIHMGHLKGTLEAFLKAFFGLKDVPLRFRPSFFPFTEPSAEVDIACRRGTDSFVLGEGTDWLEILGCGMVHSKVLENCGLDPKEWQGFAFGMGIERLAMLKYGMPDLRKFFESDARWLEHYGFAALDVPAPGMAVKTA